MIFGEADGQRVVVSHAIGKAAKIPPWMWYSVLSQLISRALHPDLKWLSKPANYKAIFAIAAFVCSLMGLHRESQPWK
jgi:hypothetical protein